MEKLTKTVKWRSQARPDPGRGPDADSLPDRARDRVLTRQGPSRGKKVPPVHERALDLLPRGRLGDRLRDAERTGRDERPELVQTRGQGHRTSPSTGSTPTPRHPYAPSGAMPQRARGTSPDFPIFGTGQSTGGHGPDDSTTSKPAVREAPAGGRPRPHRLLEQQAGAGMGRGRRPLPLGSAVPRAADLDRVRRDHEGQQGVGAGTVGADDGRGRDRGPARSSAAAGACCGRSESRAIG